MSPSAQLTSEQLKEIIEYEKMTDKDARDIQEQLDGEAVLIPANSGLVLCTVLNTINNELVYECLEAGLSLLNAHAVCQSIDDRVPRHQNSIPRLR
jgi:hypothetical protein